MKTISTTRILFGALALTLSIPAWAVDYTITDLGTLGGGNSEAYGLNNSNQIVGWASNSNGIARAFIWQKTTGIMDIGTLGGGATFAYGINDSGQVVGFSPWPTIANDYHAFLWQSGSGMSDLGTLGGSGSYALSINNKSQVVGVSNTSARSAAFLWQNGVMADLGTTGGNANAVAINDAGIIAGNTGSSAVIWQNGIISSLGTLGGRSSSTTGMNNIGQVVGNSALAGGNLNAFLWQNGSMMGLGALGGPSSSSNAHDINEHGVVVGESQTNIFGQDHAFIWQDGIGITDLNNILPSNSGWELINATAINDSGAITGFGMINGQRHAYLLTSTSAVPIPASFWLLGSGLLGLIGVARRKTA